MAGATAPAIFLGLGLRLQATGSAEGEPPSAFSRVSALWRCMPSA
jgi:hypothetical protein